MSSKKRKGEEHISEEAALGGDDGGNESIHAKMMRAQRDEFKAKLDAALLENERLKAEPCSRCHFYSDWTVHVRTMSGQVHTIACSDGPKTLIAHVKQKLAQFDPKCHILQQVTLVLTCDASSSSSAAPADPALADDRTLASCGLSKRDVVDLLLVDMIWSEECREMIELIRDGGKEIDFEYYDFDFDDDLALAVSWSLVNAINPALSSLVFDGATISASGVSKICAALCALSSAECLQVGPRISKLIFNENDIGDAGANSCSELIRVSAWLKELGLYACDISSVGAVSIGSALLAGASHQLEILNLNRNSIGSEGAKSIGEALSGNTILKKLHLNGNDIDVDGIQALAEALKVNGSLRELHIDDNGIDSVGAAFLADALQLNSSLRVMNLTDNQIGDDGAVLLSAALRVNSGLESLDLDVNGIGDRGAASFGKVLRVNAGLHILSLAHNTIGDSGAIALGIALALKSSLTCIRLDNNDIGDAGAMAIAEALCANSALTLLTLHRNKIGSLGAESIGKIKDENSLLAPICVKTLFRK